MNKVSQLELLLDYTISKNIFLYKRKNSKIAFLGYKEGIVDKNTEAFFLTAIQNDKLDKLISRSISIDDIFKNAIVIFYAISSLNNKECVFLNKVLYDEIEITEDMLSLEDFNTCDEIKMKCQKKLDVEASKKDFLNINKKVESYEMDTKFTSSLDEDDDALLSDDILYQSNDDDLDEDDIENDEDISDIDEIDEDSEENDLYHSDI